MKKKGRAFEEFVCKLERLIADTPVEISSPDFIMGKITGVLREVDISLCARVGSVQLLVIIECRDRNAVQDVRWIEEIATKREDVGANKAIAVSRTGFSIAAKKMAKAKDVDLRAFTDVDDGTVSPWVSVKQTVFEIHRLDAITLQFNNMDRPESIVHPKLPSPPRIIRVLDGELVTPHDVWREVWHREKHFIDEPVSHRPNGYTIKVAAPERGYVIETQDGPAHLTGIRIAGDCTVGAIPLNLLQHLEYVVNDDTLGRGAKVVLEKDGEPVIITIQANTHKTRYSLTVEHKGESETAYLDGFPPKLTPSPDGASDAS
ncbi:hypothetical protein ACIBQX_35085 [Nonomuraea sp. NPDC049714]|uniref:hypothetical protein n=1 Tax=Nonomuraea sp. NPDC049714 TaxID=3364357 RepID=UPI0037A22A72